MVRNQDKSSKHIRQPVADLFRRSPFKGIQAHAQKVHECIKALDKAVLYYTEGDFEQADHYIKRVVELEGEADHLKGNLRAHLPKFIFMPVERSEFLMFLREEDAVLDYAEDVAVLLEMRRSEIPKDCRKDFVMHTKKVVDTVLALEIAVNNFVNMMEAKMSPAERERLKKMIHEIHRREWEADQVEFRLSKKLFNSNSKDVIGIIHLLKVVDRTAQIANHAENAADRLRAMIAK